MAEVWVTRDDLAVGDLPPVCVVTGRPADGLVPIRFNALPGWTWVLLLLGILPFLIASLFARERVVGEVPVVAAVVERFRRRRRGSFGLGAAGLVCVAVAAAAQVAWLAWLGVLAMAAGALLAVAASRGFVDGRLDRTGLWVRLVRVHPRFAGALADHGQTIDASR
jgi:hypothetical protein